MRKLLLAIAIGFVLLVSVVVIRTIRFRPAQLDAEPVAAVSVPAGAAERLAGAIRIPTISHQDPGATDTAAFSAFRGYLEAQFPRVHSQLTREVVGEHSLLYAWQGTDPSLKPILLMGHMDVVPVEPGTEGRWQEPPFGGTVRDGYIWGRGTIDDKPSVVGTVEAVEMLLAENFRPARTVYLAFGHDEEVGGHGAKQIAALLQSRGVRLEMVLDEGGVIGNGLLPGLTTPTALVGIAEKGYVSVELTTEAEGGHSSMPPRRSAIGTLSAAIARLEENPMPARLEGPALQMFERIGPELPLAQRAVFANLWLSRPLVLRTLQGGPSTNAVVRTTTAPTIIEAGTKENVLPSKARAVVNFRIAPADRIDDVLAHVRQVIDDPSVEVRALEASSAEPSPVSPTDSEAFRTLERTIRQVAPEAIVAPYLVLGATDARHYRDLSENVYRFLPITLTSEDLARMHGTDERIAINDYEKAIRFYRQLILNMAGG